MPHESIAVANEFKERRGSLKSGQSISDENLRAGYGERNTFVRGSHVLRENPSPTKVKRCGAPTQGMGAKRKKGSNAVALVFPMRPLPPLVDCGNFGVSFALKRALPPDILSAVAHKSELLDVDAIPKGR